MNSEQIIEAILNAKLNHLKTGGHELDFKNWTIIMGNKILNLLRETTDYVYQSEFENIKRAEKDDQQALLFDIPFYHSSNPCQFEIFRGGSHNRIIYTQLSGGDNSRR